MTSDSESDREKKHKRLGAFIKNLELLTTDGNAQNERFNSEDFDLSEGDELKLETWKDINDYKFPEDRWLVPDLFPIEGISIVASISGEGKSFVTMHLAKCIAEGISWFGNESFKSQQARVLYLNLEMSKSEIARRGRKLGLSDNENLMFINADDVNLNADPENEDDKYLQLLKLIYEKRIDVVIIDTFRASAGGIKEEKAEEVRAYFKKYQILKNCGISLIFNEHLRKPTHLEGRKPRKEQLLGSTDKTANVEILLMLCREENTGNIHFYQRKNRLGAELKPFAVKMEDVIRSDGSEGIDFQYLGDIDDDSTKMEEAMGLIMGILNTGESKTRRELNELFRKEIGEKNVRAGLKELENAGKIDHSRENRKGGAHRYFAVKDPSGEALGLGTDTFDNIPDNFGNS